MKTLRTLIFAALIAGAAFTGLYAKRSAQIIATDGPAPDCPALPVCAR